MPILRIPTGRNVYEEAKARFHYLYDQFDSVVISFSGGKDSLVCLELAREIRAERGDRRPVEVVFYDEELIPSNVIDFVASYREQPDVRMWYLTLPLRSDQFVLGDQRSYVQWDPNRQHVRERPEYGVTLEDLGLPPDQVLAQYDLNRLIAGHYPGKVAIVNGIRAQESFMRLSASIAKLDGLNWVNVEKSTRKAMFCKPIFDWLQLDVFRYFYDRGVAYAPIYDQQAFAARMLRVSTPLLTEHAKHFHTLRAVDPVFYQQIVDVFPEMIVQERYWREFRAGTKESLADYDDGTDEGLFRYVTDRITDPQRRAMARRRLRAAIRGRETHPTLYSPHYLLGVLVAGQYKRTIQKDNALWAKEQKEAARGADQ